MYDRLDYADSTNPLIPAIMTFATHRVSHKLGIASPMFP